MSTPKDGRITEIPVITKATTHPQKSQDTAHSRAVQRELAERKEQGRGSGS